MPSKAFWQSLNGGWPDGMRMPTDKECVNGAKRIYRMAMGRPCPWPVKVIRHRARRTWTRSGVLYVSPEYGRRPGWPGIVHDLSHYCHSKLARGAAPHDSRQARLEREMQRFVIEKLI